MYVSWWLYFNRLFHIEKKGVWTKTLAHYTKYSFRDIEELVKKLANLVVKSDASKNQVGFVIQPKEASIYAVQLVHPAPSPSLSALTPIPLWIC